MRQDRHGKIHSTVGVLSVTYDGKDVLSTKCFTLRAEGGVEKRWDVPPNATVEDLLSLWNEEVHPYVERQIENGVYVTASSSVHWFHTYLLDALGV